MNAAASKHYAHVLLPKLNEHQERRGLLLKPHVQSNKIKVTRCHNPFLTSLCAGIKMLWQSNFQNSKDFFVSGCCLTSWRKCPNDDKQLRCLSEYQQMTWFWTF